MTNSLAQNGRVTYICWLVDFCWFSRVCWMRVTWECLGGLWFYFLCVWSGLWMLDSYRTVYQETLGSCQLGWFVHILNESLFAKRLLRSNIIWEHLCGARVSRQEFIQFSSWLRKAFVLFSASSLLLYVTKWHMSSAKSMVKSWVELCRPLVFFYR